MSCYPISFDNKIVGSISIAEFYKVGDPRPEGYLDWVEWAEVHRKARIKSVRCKGCGRWKFVTEKCCPTPDPPKIVEPPCEEARLAFNRHAKAKHRRRRLCAALNWGDYATCQVCGMVVWRKGGPAGKDGGSLEKR